jgi:4-oxalocrotonate tautomerase family enzyme
LHRISGTALESVRKARRFEMPNVYVDGPPMDNDKKRTMAQAMSKTASEAYGIPEQGIVVVIRENPSTNVCVGGKMICDFRAGETED